MLEAKASTSLRPIAFGEAEATAMNVAVDTTAASGGVRVEDLRASSSPPAQDRPAAGRQGGQGVRENVSKDAPRRGGLFPLSIPAGSTIGLKV
jgi:hypothetical protein